MLYKLASLSQKHLNFIINLMTPELQNLQINLEDADSSQYKSYRSMFM